jgi:hypothetical protein
MVTKRRAAQRREGRGTSFGSTLHPVGTSMTSLVAVVGHWLTSAMLSAAPELDSPPSAHRPTLCMEIRLTACSFDMDRPKSVRNARREAQPERLIHG